MTKQELITLVGYYAEWQDVPDGLCPTGEVECPVCGATAMFPHDSPQHKSNCLRLKFNNFTPDETKLGEDEGRAVMDLCNDIIFLNKGK